MQNQPTAGPENDNQSRWEMSKASHDTRKSRESLQELGYLESDFNNSHRTELKKMKKYFLGKTACTQGESEEKSISSV